MVTPPSVTIRSPGTVSSQLPPPDAARSTITDPGRMAATISAVIVVGADVFVVGVDATPDALTSISKGELAATVFQDAAGQGGGAVEVAVKAAKGQKMPKETWIPFKLVTPENLSQFKK